MSRQLDDRVEKLEQQLYERISPLTPEDVTELLVKGRAEGLSETEIIAFMEEHDPAAVTRGLIGFSEYCGVCDPISPVRDVRARSRDPLARLVAHIDARTLCIRTHPEEPGLPLDIPKEWDAGPLQHAALSRLVDDPEVWRSWWAFTDDERRGGIVNYYLASARHHADQWEQEDAIKARKFGKKVAARIAAIRAMPDPFQQHREEVA